MNHLKILPFLSFFLVTSYGLANAENISLPVHRFGASCDFFIGDDALPLVVENKALHEKIQDSVVSFVEFAKNHQGQATYVEFSIRSSNSAGWCMMFDDHLVEDLPSNKQLSGVDRQFGLHQSDDKNSNEEISYRLWVRTSEVNSGTMSIIFPHPSNIPSDGLFVTRRFGDTYYFSGPVILRLTEGNGFDAVALQPIGNSQFFWKEIYQIGR
ncbi:hypothetical protein GLP59_17355 [Sulfitobacter sp. M220]|uniref:hypothetical protein n=1 Tax=Sulfitobacter sp. M220 TaxID=2675333 RepID=UPI001F3184FB|nr:hypothetical protein [Sulfitobacter sp. M220]MCF7779376.1 hypothetical protein [Sulfitobacter sp. M220]